MRDVLEVIANTADGVFAVDSTGRIILWNASAERLTGYAASETLGQRCCEVFQGRDRAGNLTCFQGCQTITMARRGEPAHNYDLLTRHKTGRDLWLNISTILLPGPDNQLEATVHLFRDVTAQRQTEASLQQALAKQLAGRSTTGHARGIEQPARNTLSGREREILRLMASGFNTEAVADKLCISLATVRNHTQNILSKLGVHSKLEAVALAFKQDLFG